MRFLVNNRRWLVMILGVWLLLGAVLRFFRIEEKMRFIWDEGRDMLVVRQMIVDRDLRLLGPFNEQGEQKDFFGVFHYYLMAPALWAADFDPVGPAMLTAGLGVMSIGLVYLLVKEWESPLMGLLVAGLYAVNPLVVKYVQWPWNPNTVPFFGLLYGLAVTQVYKTKRWQWHVVAGLLLGLLFQLHYFTIALGTWWLVVWIAQKAKWQEKLKSLGLFLGGWLLPNLTFIIFDLKNNFFLSKIFLASVSGGSEQQLLEFNWSTVLPNLWNYLTSVTAGLFASEPLTAQIIALLWVGGLIFYGWQAWQRRQVSLVGLIGTSWLGLLILTSLFPSLVNDYYSSYLWFGVLLVLVKLASRIFHTKFDIWLAGLLYLGLMGYSIHANQLNRVPQWSENMPAVREVARIISNDVENNQVKNFNVVDLSTADSKATRYRYFLAVNDTEPLHPDKYPEATALYAISQKPLAERLAEPIWELESFAEAKSLELGKVEQLMIYKLNKL